MNKRYAEARLQFQQGFTDEPLQLAETGFADSVGYPDLNWKFRVLTAEARLRKRNFAQSLELLQPDPPPGTPTEIFWRRRLIQAFSLCLLNDYKQAEERLGQAVTLGHDANQGAELAYIRGRCEMSRHKWANAELFLRSALESGAISDPFLKAYVLANLGWSARQDLRYEEAIDWYGQCLQTLRALHAPFLEQQALGNLGFLYAELRDFANAIKNSEEAERIASQWKILSDEQKWLIDIGVVQQNRGQSGAAEESFNHALAIANQIKDTDVAAKCLHDLTTIKLSQGQMQLAEQYHRAGAELVLKGENLKFWQLDQAALSTGQADYSKAKNELLELLQQVEDEDRKGEKGSYWMKWIVQKELARNYATQGDAANADMWFQRSISTAEETAKKMKREELATAIRDNVPVFDGYVSFLVAQKQPENALQAAQLGRAKTLTESLTNSPRQKSAKAWVAEIQRYLRQNNSVLLSYFSTDKECFLWTITANQLRLSPLGISGPDLDNLIDTYKQEIQQHSTLNESRAARKLFQVLVQPASDLTPKGSHVIIVADSKIYSVNFETLISSQGADHYWIEDVDIENTNSINLLVAGHPRRSPTKGLLLIGDPAQADLHYVPLPHAREEMESVRKHFLPADVTSFSGRDATPDSYMNSFPGSYKFIHLATHGTPNAIDPLQSAIILYAGNGGTYKLLAQDIINDKVHLNADLVTISACEGAGTQVQSLEGLIGLEWAFMRAGAHHVVAALWDVDDTITPGLMDDFYGEIEKGKSAADALRHAKLAMLHAGGIHAVPYYWAALELYTRS